MTDERALRKEHNHIAQVKPKHIRYKAADCPACSTIDIGKMERGYAELWWLREAPLREAKRALSEAVQRRDDALEERERLTQALQEWIERG